MRPSTRKCVSCLDSAVIFSLCWRPLPLSCWRLHLLAHVPGMDVVARQLFHRGSESVPGLSEFIPRSTLSPFSLPVCLTPGITPGPRVIPLGALALHQNFPLPFGNQERTELTLSQAYSKHILSACSSVFSQLYVSRVSTEVTPLPVFTQLPTCGAESTLCVLRSVGALG